MRFKREIETEKGVTSRSEKPLTRGQRKRRLVLERVKRKQDLTGFLLREKQLENVDNIKKKCYNMSKLRREIMKVFDFGKEESQQIQQHAVKNKLSRKKVQNMKKSSMDFFKDVLQHPDFNDIDNIKLKLMDNFKNSDHGDDQMITDIATRPKKLKSKTKKQLSVKVTKSIKK